MHIPEGDLDLLAIGETVVDLISVEETDSLRHAHTFRKYLGGSPANIAVYVAKLGGASAIISKMGLVFPEHITAFQVKAVHQPLMYSLCWFSYALSQIQPLIWYLDWFVADDRGQKNLVS